MSHLVLVRHGKSEWNKLGLWTGLTDIDLSPEGRAEARHIGETIRDIKIEKAFVSKLKRAQQTFEEIKKVLQRPDLKADAHSALNERDYGVHTGKNKWQIKEAVGEEDFNKIRRGWDAFVEGGENLKDVYERVVPHYKEHVHPHLSKGSNVLVVAHGNSIRALVKHLENISNEKIPELEIGFGEVYCYKFDRDGKIIGKEIRAMNPEKGNI
ncbi:MAG TPA: 2,3-bisphosphoglycerate-dependent phosphoglycerate mutase [Candidatus Paceibacterota bacterium]